MRLALALAVLAACTDTPEERLQDLEARAITCGVAERQCFRDAAEAERVVACMNDALTKGPPGLLRNPGYDAYYNEVDYDYFAVDHKVVVFKDHPHGTDNTHEAYTEALPDCTGPFHVGGECSLSNSTIMKGVFVGVEGCP